MISVLLRAYKLILLKTPPEGAGNKIFTSSDGRRGSRYYVLIRFVFKFRIIFVELTLKELELNKAFFHIGFWFFPELNYVGIQRQSFTVVLSVQGSLRILYLAVSYFY